MARCTRLLTGLTIACLAATLLAAPAAAATPADPGVRKADRARRWTTGRVVVRWKASAPAAARRRAAAEAGGSSPARLRGDVEVLEAGDPAVTAARLTRRADVAWAEPELLRYASADEATPERATMHTGAAWAADDRMLGDGVEIAVIDEGVSATNPDLNGAGKVVDGGDCSSGTCAGTGGTSVDPDPDRSTHGTAVAAVAAAELDNTGIAGTAPGATIVAFRVFPFGDNSASSLAIASALTAAAARPAVKVINLSLGAPFVSELERDTIAEIRADRPDITIVAAAGNDGRDLPEYPAGYDGVLSVGATGPAEGGKWEPAGFSNTGDVDVLAPGVSVRSWNGGTLTNWDGTSFAAPAVAGMLAGLAAVGVTGDRARGALLASAGAPHLGTAPPVAGANGRADAKAALDLATGPSAWTALALTRGNYLANVIGRRTVEQLRFEPGAGPAGGAVPVAATIGGVDAIQDEDQTTAGAGTQGSGGLRPPAGTLTTATTTLRAPATDVGVADGSLTASGGGVSRPFPYRTTLAGSGPDGIPVEHGRLYTANLAYGVASADIHMVTLEQGHQLSLGLATPDVGVDETAVLDIWEPDTVGGTADPREPPSNAGGWLGEGTAEYTAPRDGRYAIGYVLLDPEGAGQYKLRVTCTTCPNPIGGVTAGPSPFSPNGDRIKDTATVTATTTRSGQLTVEVRTDSGALVRTLFSSTRAAGTLTTTWNGNTGLGKPAGSGRYRITARAATADGDLWTGLAQILLDRVRPTPLWMARSAGTVFPYRDGYLDTIELRFWLQEETTGNGRVDVFNTRGQRVWTTTFPPTGKGRPVPVRWNGRTNAGKGLPDGRYSWSVTMTDLSGLTGTSVRQGFALSNRRVR